MPTFRTSKELENAILSKSRVALFNMREKIYGIINKHLRVYYGEYNPTEYIRTKNLLESLVKTSSKDGLTFEVYFDASAMQYEKGEVLLQSGGYGIATWDSEKVLETAMHGSHGGYVRTSNSPIWEGSMDEIGNLVEMIKRELIAAGLPVR